MSCFFSLFIFRGHLTREPPSNRVAYFILRAYTGTGVSHSQHRKISGQVLEKMKSLAVTVACMAIYWPTPGFKGRTFKLCVLTRLDFNFCVRSSPLQEENEWSILRITLLKYKLTHYTYLATTRRYSVESSYFPASFSTWPHHVTNLTMTSSVTS